MNNYAVGVSDSREHDCKINLKLKSNVEIKGSLLL